MSGPTKPVAELHSVLFWERKEQANFDPFKEGKQILCVTIFELRSGLARCWKFCLYNKEKRALHEKLLLKVLSAPLYFC